MPTKNLIALTPIKKSLDDLTPYEHNARVHPPEQISQLVKAIKEWGFTIPLLIDESGMVLAGHARAEAAREAGLDEVPVIVADGWTDAQKQAYIIADNKLAANAEWDVGTLAAELSQLEAADIALDLVGFSDDDMARLRDDLDEVALAEMAGNKTDEGEAQSNATVGGVQFSLVMANDARKVVHDAINKCKAEYGMSTNAEALVAICKEWMDR